MFLHWEPRSWVSMPAEPEKECTNALESEEKGMRQVVPQVNS